MDLGAMLKRPKVLGVVLAGGEGKRLWPLTRDRAKPAVPFGSSYRMVDFALSNLVNGGLRRIVVLTQYKSHSLDRHLAQAWRLSPVPGDYVMSVPAQMRIGKRWFEGSADAVFQNMNLIYDEEPDVICVFGADHIYRMDPEQMVNAHLESGAGVTVAGIRVPRTEASRFGVIEPGPGGRIVRFQEKPSEAAGLPDDPEKVLASMGNYVFSTEVLVQALREDAQNQQSRHDMGGDLVTMLVNRGVAAVYDFSRNVIPGSTDRDRSYWRDVGTLDAYYDSHMDLISVHPVFNLYNTEWPILGWHPPLPPAKFVLDGEGRRGAAVDSIVGAGVIVSGGLVRKSVLSTGVRIEEGALIEESVLLDDVRVGPGAIVRRAILDKNVVVPPGAKIGVNPAEDRLRGFTVSDNGIAVMGKGDKFPTG
jgi:glucose-1-phosphate adenylyltransferase